MKRSTMNYLESTGEIYRYKKCLLMSGGEQRCPLIVLRGSEYEKGFAYGKLLAGCIASQLNSVLPAIYAELGGYEPNPNGVPTRTQLADGKKKSLMLVRRDLMPAIRDYAPSNIGRLRGLAAGMAAAGVSVDAEDILVFNTMPESFDRPKGCSNFAAWGNAVLDGAVHGVNQDFDTYGSLHKNVIMLAEEDGGRAYIGAAFAGMVNAASFVNECGLSYGELTSSSSATSWPGLPHYVQAGLLARSAKDIDAAVAVVKTTGGTTGWTLFMCESSGAAAVETAGSTNCVRIANGTCTLYATNHFRGYPGASGCLGDDMVTPQRPIFQNNPEKMERLFGRKTLEGISADTPQEWLSLMHCPRYEAYEKRLCEAYGRIDVPTAIEIQSAYPLCEAGDTMTPEKKLSLPFDWTYGKTQIRSQDMCSVYSCVFRPSKREMYLAAGASPAQAGTYYGVRLDEVL